MKAPDKIYVEACEDGIFAFPEPPFAESVEYIRADLIEQPASEGLEEEIKRWIHAQRNSERKVFGWIDMVELAARHFYELGCRYTAVMYDDIEHERQRAEEAELSEGLDAEMDKYFESMEVLEHENIFEDTFHKIARHFAEWGAEHLKK